MKLGTWTKPGTNETRVYFNGLSNTNGIKVFAVENSGMFEIRFSAGMYNSQKDAILEIIDRELEEMNHGERVVRFEDLLKLAA